MGARKLIAAAAAAAWLMPASGWTWGRQGHMTVALVAEGLLTPGARQLVDQVRRAPHWRGLLPGYSRSFRNADAELTAFCQGPEADLALVGDWADAWKFHHRATGPLHFLDLPLDSDGGPAAEAAACGGGCVVSQLASQADVLGDGQRSPEERLLALLWVVHLAGDIEQPLHCSDNGDRGGNAVRVVVGRRAGSLHEAWDTGFFYAERARPTDLARSLLAHAAHDVARGPVDPAAWARESWIVARDFVYPQERACGGAYGPQELAAAWPVVRLQLARGGVRLAEILNAAAVR